VKRASDLYDSVVRLDNLKIAWHKASKGKKLKTDVLLFSRNPEKQLQIIRQDLLDEMTLIGHYHYFKIYDPKERIICAASFPERIIHHAVMNICDPLFEKFQIHDSYACRVGKGTEKAVMQAFHFSKSQRFFLKLDIRKYFDSVSHEILKDMLRCKFKDGRLLVLFEKIIASYHVAPGRGIPIGNLTSQYFANFYLGYLDHFIKEELGIRRYVRYMDDFILWENDKESLQKALHSILVFTQEKLSLALHEPTINAVKHGVPFLGFLIFPEKIHLSQKKKKRLLKKHVSYTKALESGQWSESEAGLRLNALWAQTKLARSRRIAINCETGKRPQARTASIGAAVGTTTRRTAGLPIATTTPRPTATTTWVSGLSIALNEGHLEPGASISVSQRENEGSSGMSRKPENPGRAKN
jgi:RNA-directed DNA polymerase